MGTSEEERLILSVDETARKLGLSLASTRKGILAGEIPCIKVGHRYLIPRAALEKKLAEAGR